MTTADAPVRVLYLAGSGRSGTTIVNNILGQLDGAFAAGELRYLWQRGVVENRLCGCGEPFGHCPVWTGVMADAYGADQPDGDGVARRLFSRLRMLALPKMLARRTFGRPAVPSHDDDQTIEALYRAIAQRTGASVIVDSSKLPPYGLLLEGLPGIEVYVLHVVRDPRATAFSWLRTKQTNDGLGDHDVMQRQPVWRSTFLWLVWNTTTALFLRRRWRYVRVRYEDFVRAPEPAMRRVAEMVGLDPETLPFASPTSVQLAPTHTVAGNPARHSSGVVELRPDVEWARSMPARDRALVSALAAPAMIGLGYSLSSRAASAAAGSTAGPSPD